MLEAVLFDLDGVLARTEEFHYLAYKEAFHVFGFDLKKTAHEQHWVQEGKSLADFLSTYRLSFDEEAIRRTKSAAFLRLIQENDITMPGAIELLLKLRPNFKLAVCTSSAREAACAILTKLSLRDIFDVVVTGDDVTERKPNPESFLTATQRLKARPSNCLIVEDAEKGVRAAQSANIPVLLVGDSAPNLTSDIPRVSTISAITKATLISAYERQIPGDQK